jgi:hypothetical protein
MLTLRLLQMNYAIVVFVFVMTFAVGFWFTHGRHFYTGPLTQASATRYLRASRRDV